MAIAITAYVILGVAVSAGIATRYRKADIPKEDLYPALLIHLMIVLVWPLCVYAELKAFIANRKKQAKTRMKSIR